MVPMAPLTKPTSTHRLLVSITWAECARHMTGSSRAALSAGALGAFAPVWTAFDGGYRLSARSEFGDVLDDGFDSGVEVEGVGKRDRSVTHVGVCIMRWFQSARVTLASLRCNRMSRNSTCWGSCPACRMT